MEKIPFRRFWALALALSLAAMVSCGGQSGPADPVASATPSGSTQAARSTAADGRGMTLAFTANDTLNPYEAKTKANLELCELLYEGLVRLDNDFKAEYRLASKIALEGRACVVTLRNAVFSDGSAVTAEDVAYSYRQAAAKGSPYETALSGVSSASAAGESTVEFKLKSRDPFFINLLDFPVVKKDSLNRESSDNRALPPIGCGRYVLESEEEGYYLKVNDRSFDKPAISRIELLNLPDQDAVIYNAGAGLLDWYYTDLSDNTLPKMNGKQYQVNLNHLVFIGINCNKAPLNDQNLRQALSLALNRSAIVENAFFAGGIPATGLYNPAFEQAQAYQSISSGADLNGVSDALERAGYEAGEDGIYQKNDAKLTLSLLYNEENSSRKSAAELIASQMKRAGVEITLRPARFSQYQTDVQNGNFDLYLGEMRLQANMDLQPLLSLKGMPTRCETLYAYEDFKNGRRLGESVPETTAPSTDAASSAQPAETATGTGVPATTQAPRKAVLSDVCAAFAKETPIIPICYRNGILTYSSKITGTVVASTSDLYYTISTCGYEP